MKFLAAVNLIVAVIALGQAVKNQQQIDELNKNVKELKQEFGIRKKRLS